MWGVERWRVRASRAGDMVKGVLGVEWSREAFLERLKGRWENVYVVED